MQNIPTPPLYNYQIFNQLIFPLEEVRKYRDNQYNQSNQNQFNNPVQLGKINTKIVTLQDCFDYYQRPEYLTGENQYYCYNCRQLVDVQTKTEIYSHPEVLILILNRGKDNVSKVGCNFPESYSLTTARGYTVNYELIGVITHLGKSGSNAFFFSSIKSFVNNKWYRMNDSMVSPVTDFDKDVRCCGEPCILFYIRKDFEQKQNRTGTVEITNTKNTSNNNSNSNNQNNNNVPGNMNNPNSNM